MSKDLISRLVVRQSPIFAMFSNLCCCVKAVKDDDDTNESSKNPPAVGQTKSPNDGAPTAGGSGKIVTPRPSGSRTQGQQVNENSGAKQDPQTFAKSDRKNGLFSKKDQKKSGKTSVDETGAIKDRINKFEAPPGPEQKANSDLLREKDGTKPKKKKPTSKAFQEFETSGILIGFGHGPRQKKTSDDITEEDAEISLSAENLSADIMAVHAPGMGSRSRSRDHSNSNSNANSLSRLTDDEGVHTMDEEDEFAAVTRNSEVLKSFRRAPPPKNRAKGRPHKRMHESRNVQSSMGFDFLLERDEDIAMETESDGQPTPSRSIDSIESRSDRATPDDDTGTSGHITGDDSPRGTTPDSAGVTAQSSGSFEVKKGTPASRGTLEFRETTPELRSVSVAIKVKPQSKRTIDGKDTSETMQGTSHSREQLEASKLVFKSRDSPEAVHVTKVTSNTDGCNLNDSGASPSAKQVERAGSPQAECDTSVNYVILDDRYTMAAGAQTSTKMQNDVSPVLRPPSLTSNSSTKSQSKVTAKYSPHQKESNISVNLHQGKNLGTSRATNDSKSLNITAAKRKSGSPDITSPTYTSSTRVLLKDQQMDEQTLAQSKQNVKIRSFSVGHSQPGILSPEITSPTGEKLTLTRPRSFHPTSFTRSRDQWAKSPSKSVDYTSRGRIMSTTTTHNERSKSLVPESSEILRKWDSELSGLDAKRRRREEAAKGESPKRDSEKHPLSMEARKKVFQARWETAI